MLPADQANRRYFREAYRSGEHGWAVREPSPIIVRRLQRLSDELPGAELLDLGCGEGRHSIAAARLGFSVTGVDYEPLAVRRARRFARSAGAEVTFLVADAFHLPFPEGAFEVVVDCGCLHHQRKSDWPRYLSSVTRALRPGGFVVLMVFSPRFRFFRGSGRKWHIARGAYRRCFEEEDIRALFGGEFDILQIEEERGDGRGFWHCLLRHTDHEERRER